MDSMMYQALNEGFMAKEIEEGVSLSVKDDHLKVNVAFDPRFDQQFADIKIKEKQVKSHVIMQNGVLQFMISPKVFKLKPEFEFRAKDQSMMQTVSLPFKVGSMKIAPRIEMQLPLYNFAVEVKGKYRYEDFKVKYDAEKGEECYLNVRTSMPFIKSQFVLDGPKTWTEIDIGKKNLFAFINLDTSKKDSVLTFDKLRAGMFIRAKKMTVGTSYELMDRTFGVRAQMPFKKALFGVALKAQPKKLDGKVGCSFKLKKNKVTCLLASDPSITLGIKRKLSKKGSVTLNYQKTKQDSHVQLKYVYDH